MSPRGAFTDDRAALTWTRRDSAGSERSIMPVASGTGGANRPRHDVDIVVEGNRITSVEPHRAALHTGTVVDASRPTVIPA